MSAHLNQYQQNQIETASPEQILLMLYDGAIRFTRQAMTGLKSDDLNVMRYGISKAMAIIVEFSNSLNHEIGGQIAEDLDGLYGFMIRELTHCNINPELKKLEDVEKILVDLRGTWGEAVEINKQEQQSKAIEEQAIPELSEHTSDEKKNGNVEVQQTTPPAPQKPLATGTYGATGAAAYTNKGLPASYTPFSASR